MKKIIRSIVWLLVGWNFLPVFADALDIVYDEPQGREYASDKDAEDLFDTKIGLDINLWKALDWDKSNNDEIFDFWLKWSVIAKTTQFLLRMVVILAVPMLLYTGIKIALAAGDEAKLKESLKQVWMVLLWVFVALLSVVIVFLIISITRSNLPNL